MTGPRIGELCAGYSGIGLAVTEVLGGEVAWVADNDPGASAILAHRFPSVPNYGDITVADWGAVEPVDIVTGGWPCPPVSQAGRHKGVHDERWLWDGITAAIGGMVTRPRLLLLENVAGLLSANGGDAMARVVQGLAALGYVGRYGVLRASDAGAPHARARVFILGRLAADAADGGRHELDDGREPRAHGAQSVDWLAGVAGDDRGGRLAAADPERNGLERCGPASGAHEGWQAAARIGRRPSIGGVPAADANCPASDQWWLAAPGQAEGGRSRADAGGRGGTPAADADRSGLPELPERDSGALARINRALRDDALGRVLDWGQYGLAIRRWERVLGRPAPAPTEPGRTGQRLSPAFVEWLMGLPEGWVTDVPGLSRNAQLKALGNGVVPAQAAMALRLLLDRAGIPHLIAAKGDAA